MPSPFPGMDPFIESPRFWSGFHSGLAYLIMSHLNPSIQPVYYANTTMSVTYDVVEISTGQRNNPQVVFPDAAVWKKEPVSGGVASPVAVITPAPVESVIAYEVPLQLYRVEIRVTETDELVTIIEILSPVNKRRGHEAYSDYLRKRRDMVRAGINLLEIDLLRAGTRPPLEQPIPRAPYYVTLSRRNRRPRVEVWPIQLRDRLPVLPVPLLEPDPDVPLDLGALVQTIYNNGPYAAAIDYNDPLPPPLNNEENQFVQDCLQQAGLIKE